jgi:predicted transcriptional regulator
MKPTAPNMVIRYVWLEPRQHAALKRISTETKQPMAALVREGVTRVLDLAEKQQDCVERILAQQDHGG